jgi:serine/threonine protein kinase
MSCPLEKHGFVGIDLRADYSNVCDVLPAAREIARLGRPVMIAGHPWRFLDRSFTRDDIYVGWYIKEIYAEGTYGKILKSFRTFIRHVTDASGREGFVTASPDAIEVVLKQTQPTDGRTTLTAEEVTAHMSEALLHILAWNVLQRTTLPWAVPRPYEVFGDAVSGGGDGWTSLSLCMDFVQGHTLHAFLEKVWKRETPRANGILLLEVLAQTACILYVLQRFLRLNHRDVKDNNLLIRRRPTAVRVALGGQEIYTQYELTLIDFGFACVGCPPPRAPISAFQASTYFPPLEMCCKPGRDLAQLIYCIHCYFPLHEFLPWELYRELRSWVQVRWNGGVADLFRGFADEAGTPVDSTVTAPPPPKYNKSIYEFLRRAEVDAPLCEPVRLFAACSRLKQRYL